MPQLKLKNNQGAYNPIGPDYHVTVNQMPTVAAADNGKFARVVNGEWVAATVPQAESSNTYTNDTYIMLGASFSSLNDAVNTKCGTSGNHTLTEMIALLTQTNAEV